MASTSRYPYPPCVSDFCAHRGCCAPGYKYEWPELVGKDGKYARAVIEKDNPFVTVFLLPDGARGLADFCCNRVYVYLDADSKVYNTPLVG